MRFLPFIFLLGTPAFAEVLDLRGVDVGAPCQGVPPSELALGAAPKFAADLMLQKGLLLFQDDGVAGQSTVILYGCAGSPATVVNYAITVSTTEAARAKNLFVRTKTVITTRLGTAAFDSGKLNAADRKVFQSVPGGPEALVTWQTTGGYSVHLSLHPPPAAGQWSVVTSVAPAEPADPGH